MVYPLKTVSSSATAFVWSALPKPRIGGRINCRVSSCVRAALFTHGVPVDLDVLGVRVVPDAAAAQTLSVETARSQTLFDLVVDVRMVLCASVSSDKQLAVLNLGDFLGHLDEHVLWGSNFSFQAVRFSVNFKL